MDCVWQILRQAPLLFEVSSFVELTLASIDMFCVYQFTEEFLMAILDHLYDCRFGFVFLRTYVCAYVPARTTCSLHEIIPF